MDVWIIESVTAQHSDLADEPRVTRCYEDYGYFTDEAEAGHIAGMLDGMSGQSDPNDFYDPTGCNRIDTFTTVHFEARKVSPAPEDLYL